MSDGDLNGDGTLDIVLAKGRHWPLVDKVLFNDRSYSASLADLDGDGDLDIVIGNDSPDPKLVYLNDGKATSTWGLRMVVRSGQ